VSHYQVRGFEDVVIFCHDVEQRLAKLNPNEQQLIKRIALQRYTRGETAGMLGIGLNTCTLRYGQAVDRLTGLLLESGLLDLSRR
jgi:DNA-directed RNA polymerase specialized sigma24 family protein